METKIEADASAIVSAVLQFDAELRANADLMAVRDEDFARMAEAFGFSPERRNALSGLRHF